MSAGCSMVPMPPLTLFYYEGLGWAFSQTSAEVPVHVVTAMHDLNGNFSVN